MSVLLAGEKHLVWLGATLSSICILGRAISCGRCVLGLLFSFAVMMRVEASEVRVAVASNFAAPMRALAAEFEGSSQHTVKIAYGSSGKFYAQITHGAPFDVFFSADQAKPAALLDANLALSNTQFTYAVGRLVLWSANFRDITRGAEVLAGGEFNKLALANPKLAPYGTAAVQALESLGLKAETQPKWVLGENISQAFQFVSTGNADLGFVAGSQLVQLQREGQLSMTAVWQVPQALYSPVRQDAVLLVRGAKNPAAIDLLAFMQSPKAQAIIESYGYSVP